MNHPKTLNTRGESTSAALIEAGLTLFGELGYEATTTRDLCQACGANVSAIPYHFGSKHGLYCAVIEHIGARVQSASQISLNDVQNGTPLSPEAALQALQDTVLGMSKLVIENKDSRRWAKIMIREQAKPSSAFDFIYNNHIKPLQKTFAFLIASIRKEAAEDDSIKIRSHALMGQILAFVVNQESIARWLECESLSDSHRELIYSVLLEHVKACVGSVKHPS